MEENSTKTESNGAGAWGWVRRLEERQPAQLRIYGYGPYKYGYGKARADKVASRTG